MKEKYHLIGIGGIGMSGLAHLLLQQGIPVTGSDVAAGPQVQTLIQAGAKVHIGHSATHVEKDATVVYSTDIKKENPEYQAALQLGCTLLHRSQLLQRLMQKCRHSLCVAGTHGKTTTSSLLTWVLHVAGLKPSFAIGGVIPQFKSNSGHGSHDFFVAEACESDGTFLNYLPYGAIVTNIDEDHMDFYGTLTSLVSTFETFMKKITDPHLLFYCGDDPLLRQIKPQGTSYGFSADCQLRITHAKAKGWMQTFDVQYRGKEYREIDLSLIGSHNILNAAAIFGLALELGVEEAMIRKAFATFSGVLRRCERKGECEGILFIDDYAHHPTELKATLQGLRSAIGDRRLIAAYQPHRYTRSQSCLGKYEGVFEEVDHLFVSEIYSAREQPIPGITTEVVVADIQGANRCPSQFVERSHLAQEVADFLKPGDLVVTLGAGDITKLSSEVLQLLAKGAACG